MMDDKMTELYRLMTEEILGTISSADGKKMSLLLQEEWAQVEWEKFHKTFETQEAIDKVAALIKDETATSQLEQRSRNLRPLLFKSIAAILLVALIAGGSYYFPRGKKAASSQTAGGVQLQLADGEIIDLSDVTAFHASDAVFYNDTAKDMLSYKPSASLGKQHVLSVPAGMTYHLRLPDGTTIFLNASTQLFFPSVFTGKREITIRGEAYLDVAKDANQPFIVHLPHTDVEVLGTSFNVNTYDTSAVKVSLREGSVRLISGKRETKLQPGTQAVIKPESKDIQVQEFSTDELHWIKDAYIMDNSPVSALPVVFPDWFGIRVVIDDAAAGKKRFTGMILKNEPIDSFLRRLERMTGVTTYFKDSVLHIQ